MKLETCIATKLHLTVWILWLLTCLQWFSYISSMVNFNIDISSQSVIDKSLRRLTNPSALIIVQMLFIREMSDIPYIPMFVHISETESWNSNPNSSHIGTVSCILPDHIHTNHPPPTHTKVICNTYPVKHAVFTTGWWYLLVLSITISLCKLCWISFKISYFQTNCWEEWTENWSVVGIITLESPCSSIEESSKSHWATPNYSYPVRDRGTALIENLARLKVILYRQYYGRLKYFVENSTIIL